MKKTVSIIIAVILAVCAVAASVPVYAESAPSIKHVLNGDAELGDTTGWKCLASGTTLANVKEDGKNNRVIEVTAPTDGNFLISAMFDIGALVYDDEANGYAGFGAGNYKISLNVKIKDASKFPCYAHVTLVSGTLDHSNAQVVATHPEYWPESIIGFTQNNWLVLGGNSNAEYTVTALDNGWFNIQKTFAVTQGFIDANKARFTENADAYGLYVALDNLVTDYYVDEVEVSFNGKTIDPHSEILPQKHEVVNYDAESGDIAGWKNQSNTGIENVKLGGNRVIKVTPPTSGSYLISGMFDIGAAVFNDEANGYFGKGVGNYTVSIKLKFADESDSSSQMAHMTLVSGTLDQTNANMVNSYPQYWPNKILGYTQPSWIKFGPTESSGAEYKVDKIDDDWYTISKTFDINQTFYEEQDSKELYVAFDNITIPYYLDDVTVSFGGKKLVPAPKAKTVVNGDAEGEDISGWGKLFGKGTVTRIADPENVNKHVIEFVPNANDTYASIAFDLGAEIVNDPDFMQDGMYYAGGGAGYYNVSFRIRAAEDNGEKRFNLTLQSGHWESGSLRPTAADNKIMLNGTEWKNVSFCFNVTKEYLEKLANNKTSDAYKLFVRIDGNNNAFEDSRFTYYVDDFEITKLAFSAAGVSLDNSFSLSYYVPQAVYEQDFYVEFDDGVKYDITKGLKYENLMGFTVKGIAPHNINDKIAGELYIKVNGEYVLADTLEYSIADYCNYQIKYADDDDNDDLRKLCIDLLNYGAATQEYEKYKTQNLANALLNDVQKAYGGASKYPTLSNITNTKYSDNKYFEIASPAFTWKGAQLVLNNSLSCLFNFKAAPANAATPAYACVEIGATKKVIKVFTQNKDTGVYTLRFDGMLIDKMREPMYVTLYDASDKPISNTLRYSAESYISKKIKDTTPGLAKLVEMLIKYGDSAMKYSKSPQ